MQYSRKKYAQTSSRSAKLEGRNARSPKSRVLKWPIVTIVLALIAAAGVFAYLNSGYHSPYNWNNLKWADNNRASYVVDGEVKSKLGVDVSSHDGEIDWSQVAQDGIEFAYIRIGWRGYTEGNINTDEYFLYNISRAKAAGLQVGVYFFSQAISSYEAYEEAQFVLETLGDIEVDLPIVFDHETVSDSSGRANNLSTETATALANRFCVTLENAGYQTMIYGNQKDMRRFDSSLTKNRAVWLAQYKAGQPSAQFDFTIWQYTDSGNVKGMNKACDMDIWFTDVLPLDGYY